MKKLFIVGAFALGISFFIACGDNNSSSDKANTEATTSTETEQVKDVAEYDPHRGEGSYNDFEPSALDQDLVAKGISSYESKCQSCHKLTDERLVGPGWAGVTERRTGAWLLNFITNPDVMLDQDPELLKQIEICMVRMPNQNVGDEEARALYDFMRKNDGVK